MSEIPISYRLLRSARRTLGLTVTPDGEVIVRAPKRASLRQIEQFVGAHAEWIRKKQELMRRRAVERAKQQLPPFTAAELAALKKQARVEFPPRMAELARRMGLSFDRLAIRAQKTRWGSCSAKRSINLNCLLVLVPEEVRDYVMIHELCHLRHLNHSPAFWKMVEYYDPDYRQHRRWLREHEQVLIGRLPEREKDN